MTELHNRQVIVETAPSGELYVLTFLDEVAMEDQTIGLQRNFSLRALIRFRVEGHISKCLYYRRPKYCLLVMCLDFHIVVESHTRNHMQVILSTVGATTRGGTRWRILENVHVPVTLVGLGLHEETVTRDCLTVQGACTRYATHTVTATTEILKLLVDVDVVRSHSCKTTLGDSRSVGILIKLHQERTCLIFACNCIAMEVITAGCAVVAIADLSLSAITARRIILAQERIVTRTDVLQTSIVQLDVIICADKYTTACAVCFVFEILQIDVVSFLFTTAELHFR